MQKLVVSCIVFLCTVILADTAKILSNRIMKRLIVERSAAHGAKSEMNWLQRQATCKIDARTSRSKIYGRRTTFSSWKISSFNLRNLLTIRECRFRFRYVSESSSMPRGPCNHLHLTSVHKKRQYQPQVRQIRLAVHQKERHCH